MYSKEQIKEAWNIANQHGIQYFGNVGHNAKTIKSDNKTEYLTWIMYLAASDMAGQKYNVCPHASPGCRAACLVSAGRGATSPVRRARIRRTRFWFEEPTMFKRCVFDEIYRHREKCLKRGVKPAARMNATSDIIWEKMWPELFDYFYDVQFYEYSKIARRMMPDWKIPDNLHLTFSRSETNQQEVDKIIKSNPDANISVVFDNLPDKWMGRKVIDGDQYDARFLDPRGVIVGLKTKGKGIYDKTGFVVKS